MIKAPFERAVDVEHAAQFSILDERNDDFAVGSRVAGDMSGKLMHVIHDDRLSFGRRRAAYAAASRNADACRKTLEWIESTSSCPS